MREALIMNSDSSANTTNCNQSSVYARLARPPQEPLMVSRHAHSLTHCTRSHLTVTISWFEDLQPMARKEPLRGRPRPTRLKPEKARKLIRRFHVLLKSKAAAENAGRSAEARALEAEIEKLGGLDMYQQASISGQSKGRGGDSSRLLVKWLPTTFRGSLLEVGCLQVDNACAQTNRFRPHVRIDLNSQHPQIQKQDFMTMPIQQYDVVSLSLVVNYVPDAVARGQMMQKAHKHLSSGGLLFFVLPRACVDNSRYCNGNVMQSIFRSVGLLVEHEKKTSKLIYWLLRKSVGTGERVAKLQVNDGSKMNNFSMIID